MSFGAGGLIHAVRTLECSVAEFVGAVGARTCGGTSMTCADVYLHSTEAPTKARTCIDVSVIARMSLPAVEILRMSVGRMVEMSRMRARASVTLVTAR